MGLAPWPGNCPEQLFCPFLLCRICLPTLVLPVALNWASLSWYFAFLCRLGKRHIDEDVCWLSICTGCSTHADYYSFLSPAKSFFFFLGGRGEEGKVKIKNSLIFLS